MRFRAFMLVGALAAGLAPGASEVLAAEPTSSSPGPLQPRFELGDARLSRAVGRQSGGAYALDARLQRASPGPQSGSGLELDATLAPTGTAACGNAGDSIFANGFE